MKQDLINFWLWMIKEVQPDIIEAKEVIECDGWTFDGFTPVLPMDTIVDIYLGKEEVDFDPEAKVCPNCKRITTDNWDCPKWATSLCSSHLPESIQSMLESDFYKTRPDIIKRALRTWPPTETYALPTGKQVFIKSIEEPESGKFEDITVTVVKIGKGGPLSQMGTALLEQGQGVFGVDPSTLTLVPRE